MDPKTNYTLVGVFVLALISALTVVSLWLSTSLDNRVYKNYAIYMNESVSGLSEQSAVKFNGVAVGYVKEIDLNDADPQQVRIIVEIQQSVPITTSTTATLKSQGITGLTYIGLTSENKIGKPLTRLKGELYPVIRYTPSFLFQLDKSAKEVAESVKGVTNNLGDVLNKKNAESLEVTLKNLGTITTALAKQTQSFQAIVKNTSELLSNAQKASQRLPEVMENFEQGLVKVGHMSNSLTRAGNEVSLTMQSSRRTLNSFERQALPPAVTLMNKLDRLADTLDGLAKELRQNPSIVIRGKAMRQLGPGEH